MEIINSTIRSFFQHFGSLLVKYLSKPRKFIQICDLCLQPSDNHSLLCRTCQQDLTTFNLTQVQGNLLNHPKIALHLPQIRFQQLICLAPYQWPFANWVQQLKYQQRFEIGQLLARLLVEQVSRHQLENQLPTLLLPVPIHPQRLRERQYNQAALIAKELSKCLPCAYDENLVIRQSKTEQQVGQSGAQRRRNLQGAFCLVKPCNLPVHVGIVDDVLTTGATVSEMAKVLTQHGVKKITVLSVCLTMPK
ncbi:hypothetical protein A9Q98_07865 [Thalassotalea sp. 42_200_T64]|nr:hypothetical protein A9Q98_07865 [Thalassotalea sp. 42_200_T64]